MEYSAKQILSCVGSHHEVKVGEIIMPQQVATNLGIDSQQAKRLLSELEQRGFLLYEEGNGGKNQWLAFYETRRSRIVQITKITICQYVFSLPT